jgi:hypothetical protein
MIASVLTTRSWFIRLGRPVMIFALLATAGLSAASSAGAATTPRPYLQLAKVRWLSEAQMVSSAWQNIPLESAAHDLELGLAKGGDTAGYTHAITTIEAFERIPITSETRVQMLDSHRDWTDLNTFFNVGMNEARVLLSDAPSGSMFDKARKYFNAEPSGIHSGVHVDLLQSAVRALRFESSAQGSRAILYGAAISDLNNLQSASATQIAASNSNPLNPYRQDIDYLNVLFETGRLESPGGSPGQSLAREVEASDHWRGTSRSTQQR